MKAVLSIAGSDSSGGAGIQADIKTITAHLMFAETVVTALTAQNTQGVSGVSSVDDAFVAQQIDAVFEDIRPDAVKIGMISSADTASCIADRLARFKAENIVLDPVMVATSGSKLMGDAVLDVMIERLFPLSSVITPNIPELEVLCGHTVGSAEAQEAAARELAERYGIAVLAKGGHGSNDANDVLVESDGTTTWFEGERVDTGNTHGTGCTLSSAIACGLATGVSLSDAVRQAKRFVTGALSTGLDLGKGCGPLNHCWNLGLRE